MRTMMPGGAQHEGAYPARTATHPQTQNFSSGTVQWQLGTGSGRRSLKLRGSRAGLLMQEHGPKFRHPHGEALLRHGLDASIAEGIADEAVSLITGLKGDIGHGGKF